MKAVFVIAAAMAVAGCARLGGGQSELDQLERCARAAAMEAEALERSDKTPGLFQKGPMNVSLTEANARAQIAATKLRVKACAT
jgi:hypothetical protein